MRIIPWTTLVGVLLLCACTPEETTILEEEISLLDDLTIYQIQLRGEALDRNIPFLRSACLVLSPRIEEQGAEDFQNGDNVIDIGLVSGQPSTTSELGALWFFTNTQLCRFSPNGCTIGATDAALDLAFVDYDSKTGRVTADIDPLIFDNEGAIEILYDGKTFVFSGGTEQEEEVLYTIIRGSLELFPSEDLQSISGTISFTGRKRNGTGLAQYKAEFTGGRMRAITCW